MRRTLIPVAAATLAFSAIAYAAPAEGPSTAPGAAPSGSYVLDPGHTTVMFSLKHMGYSNYYGRFNDTAGTLEFDSKAPEKSKLNVTIKTASIDTNHPKLEAELKGDQWLDAGKYPTITFTNTTIQKLSDTKGKLTGNLTLHGITKPVTLDVTFNGAGKNPLNQADMLGFSATGSLKRSDFGVSQYVPMVGDALTLTIETEFMRKQ